MMHAKQFLHLPIVKIEDRLKVDKGARDWPQKKYITKRKSGEILHLLLQTLLI